MTLNNLLFNTNLNYKKTESLGWTLNEYTVATAQQKNTVPVSSTFNISMCLKDKAIAQVTPYTIRHKLKI
jgi:hypothetical protein